MNQSGFETLMVEVVIVPTCKTCKLAGALRAGYCTQCEAADRTKARQRYCIFPRLSAMGLFEFSLQVYSQIHPGRIRSLGKKQRIFTTSGMPIESQNAKKPGDSLTLTPMQALQRHELAVLFDGVL